MNNVIEEADKVNRLNFKKGSNGSKMSSNTALKYLKDQHQINMNGFSITANAAYQQMIGMERDTKSMINQITTAPAERILPKKSQNDSKKLLKEEKIQYPFLTEIEKGNKSVTVKSSKIQVNISDEEHNTDTAEELKGVMRIIPKTGIEQPFLLDNPTFSRSTNEYERTNDISPLLKSAITEDYKLRESSRIINLAKTVYDVERESPHYRDQKDYFNIAK
jgi:hypothetical protein